MFLQLHDGPELPYGIQKYPYPKYTGKMMPVSTAENPYAAGAPVMKLSPYAVLNGCDPAQVYAQFVPQDAGAWKVQMNQIDQGAKLWKDYQSIRAAAGTGSAPIYDAAGNITGYKQASKVEEALAWYELGKKVGRLFKGSIDAGEARRLRNNAQELWDQNKWGLQNLCGQSMSQLQLNAENCYNSLQWWLADASKYGNKQSGPARVANRAVVIRQNALLLLVKQIEEKGGKFTPGQKDGAPISAAAILAALGALAFLRF
jgi:YD repeat-containing protein